MVKILHLYYDLMNLYGEYGNIVVLCDNLKRNNIDYSVDKLTVNDDIDFNKYDFIYCGSGSENKTDIAFNDLIKRKEGFVDAINNGKYILFTGSSLMLLGKTYDKKEGLNVFEFAVTKGNKRLSGDVIVSSNDYQNIVGFINTSFVINSNEKQYINIIGSDDEFKGYNALGYKKNNLLSINITGPLLVRNPQLLKEYIINLGNINNNFVYQDTIKKNQYDSYKVALNELNNRFNIG